MRVTFPFEITKFFDTKINIETGKKEIILKKNYAFAVEENFKAIKKYFNDLINTENIIPQGLDASIVIKGGSIGTSQIEDGAITPVLLSESYASAPSWTNWIPTYGASGGMTYTSVSTIVAEYFIIGKVFFFTLMCMGITGGSPADAISFTLPIATAESVDKVGGACHIYNGGRMSGTYYNFATTIMRVYKYDGSNWGLGSGRSIYINGFYKID